MLACAESQLSCFIPLRRRDHSVKAWVTVDAEDYERLSRFSWTETNGYARRIEKVTPKRSRGFAMAREVLGLVHGDGLVVDHINRDKLDNRKRNLRVGSFAQNMQNREAQVGSASRYRGVSWDKACGKWRASVGLSGTLHELGRFTDEEEAAAVAAAFRAEYMPFSEEAIACL